jgi:DNA sulfur modification protein DndB
MRRAVLEHRIAVVIHHGMPVEDARQAFYDLNVLEVKPNAAVAIGMDQRDPATAITKRLSEESDVLRGRVHMQRRQLRRSDPELVTISGLRQAVVCTILGEPGIQVGAKPIVLDDAVDLDELADVVVALWDPILEELEDTLKPERRAETVVAAPAFLCGIGVVAHHAMPNGVRRSDVAPWTPEDVVEHLEGVIWERELADGSSPWEGIGARKVRGERKDGTPYERWTLGGPKEVGYQVARALEDAQAPDGQRIRRG